MTNEDLKEFGTVTAGVFPNTLEPGDTDKNGNQYADHDAYEVEMDRQADKAKVALRKFDLGKPF